MNSFVNHECKNLHLCKCKYAVADDKSHVRFRPSPHLYDQKGEFRPDINKHGWDSTNLKDDIWYDSIKSAIDRAAKEANCTKLCSFTDFECNKEYRNNKVSKAQRHKHPFIGAALHAYCSHYPLTLKPSHIWLLILQGIATHVELNAEKVRSKWVDFKGKRVLTYTCKDTLQS